jgi:hypothetical protein
MKTWVRRSINAGALTAGALLATGAGAAHAAVPNGLASGADNIGILNGTQLAAPIQAPVNLCGNAIAVGGAAKSDCVGGATALNPEWGFSHYAKGHDKKRQAVRRNVGILNGTQLIAPIQVPVNVCGVAIAVLGNAEASCGDDSGGGYGGNEHGVRYQGKHRQATAEAAPAPVAGPAGLAAEVLGSDPTGAADILGSLPVVGSLANGLTPGHTPGVAAHN